ncbi:MAG: prolipoprotein diacylglyceryl transferase [Candidatus Binataceae bacterium]|jgi:phosphatidylglycerol:prolipoprotein diacylglycerol transferase
MIPVLLRIGPLTVYSYGLMMALGFIAGDYVLTRECRRRGISAEFANALVLWGAIAGIVGSRIYAVLDDLPAYLADPKAIIFSGSGFVFYGGLIAGILSTWIVSRRHGVPFARTTDLCVAPLVLGQAFGRMGCQLSGDGDWGLPSTVSWAMAYPRAIVGWNEHTVLKLGPHDTLVSGFFPGVRVLPTPIFESTIYVIIFAVLIAALRRPHRDGHITSLYLILAGLERFVVEFWRINPRVLWGLTEAQLISAGMILTGTVILLLMQAREGRGMAAQSREVASA